MAILPKSPSSRPKSTRRRHVKGQDDHVDAWLMSYADLITLKVMLFVIFVSISVSKHEHPSEFTRGELEHPYLQKESGTLALGTPYDEAYRTLLGIVLSGSADQHIAVEKTSHSLSIDISAVQFFDEGSADIPGGQLPLLKAIAHSLKVGTLIQDNIEVEGYTDDETLKKSKFANNWELASMRAARIVVLLAGEGIDPARLRATSYAGNHPVVPNKDAAGNPILENRKRNQRVVITVEKSALPITESLRKESARQPL